MDRELMEAIAAGERALHSLRGAHKALGSAKNWGLWDLFGGGFLTDMMKHSRLDNAMRRMEAARQDLRIFEMELRDVDVTSQLNVDVGDFLTFADFFFDGMVADYMVYSRIAEMKERVEEAIDRVTYLLATLQERGGRAGRETLR